MASQDLHFLTIADAGRLMKSKSLSPVELTEAFLERIGTLDGQISSYVTVTDDFARGQAKAAEEEIAAGDYRGPMHGIPYGLKDLVDVKGVATTACSRLLIDTVAEEDATAARRLHEAGAIHLGKHNCQEFASSGPCFDLPWPPARNPWDPERTPGGSSTGSGAAIAAGLAMAALGTDVGGSIRNPAGYCGLVGLKPTYGRVSRRGMIPCSWTLDHLGPMAWTTEDCAIVLGAIAGYDPFDPGSADEPVPDFTAGLADGIKGLRIGHVRHFYEEDFPAKEEVMKTMANAVDVLRDLGCVIEDIRLPSLLEYGDPRRIIAAAEFYAFHEKNFMERGGSYGVQIRNRFFQGATIRAVDYIQAQRNRLDLIRRTNAAFETCDMLLTASQYGPPTVLTAAPWKNDLGLSVTGPFNVTGHPALAVPSGFSAEGLPMSVQLIGRPFDEATVLRAGHAFEQTIGTRDRRPTLETKAAA